MRPRLLDLFCKAGGASMGYFRAGFDVVGVDIEDQPNYPFDFIQMDALLAKPEKISSQFDAVAASPPCQAYSVTRTLHINEHPELIDATRFLLFETGLPYVIENVPGAPLLDPVTLCGSSFGLPLRRHRLFEVNWDLEGLPCDHAWQNLYRPYTVHASAKKGGSKSTGVVSVHGNEQHQGPGGWSKSYNRWLASVAMGIDWMTKHELNQAIPPAYTYFIGRQLWLVLGS